MYKQFMKRSIRIKIGICCCESCPSLLPHQLKKPGVRKYLLGRHTAFDSARSRAPRFRRVAFDKRYPPRKFPTTTYRKPIALNQLPVLSSPRRLSVQTAATSYNFIIRVDTWVQPGICITSVKKSTRKSSGAWPTHRLRFEHSAPPRTASRFQQRQHNPQKNEADSIVLLLGPPPRSFRGFRQPAVPNPCQALLWGRHQRTFSPFHFGLVCINEVLSMLTLHRRDYRTSGRGRSRPRNKPGPPNEGG